MKRLAITLLALLHIGSIVHGAGEEHFGNAPVNAANYSSWPGAEVVINHPSRVYRNWVNGNENFYFRGGTEAVNEALQAFAQINVDRLVVVLRPAPASTSSFDANTIDYHWRLHLLGGIAKHMSTRDKGDLVWDVAPHLHVHVGDSIQLDQLAIPDNVQIMQISELQARYKQALTSTYQDVRGWTCGNLLRLDRYSLESLRAVSGMLDDDVDWVKRNAALAIKGFRTKDANVIAKLEAFRSEDASLTKAITEALETQRGLEVDDAETTRQRRLLDQIQDYVSKRSAK